MTRDAIRERYAALPLPTTKDEHWRFTDLKDFDPDAWTANGATEIASPPTMLELDASGVVHVGEAGLEIVSAPEGIRFEALPEDHELLYSLVGFDEKFAAHNAAMWTNGLLVHVPRGVVLEKPLYVRIANSVEGGSVFWRLLVVAEPESRFTLIEECTSSTTPDLGALHERGRRDRRTAGGEGRVRVRAEPLARHVALRLAPRAVERDAELDWVTGGFGSAKGKIRIQNDLAGQGATSRVTGAYFADGTQHLDYDTFQEHIAPSTTSDFAFKGALRDTARVVWRGMIRVEEGAQKTNAYQENRNLLLSKSAHADSIPGLEIMANDVRCTHGATLGQVDREQLFYLMSRGLSRSEAERLIVRGFFQDVLDRVELEPVREALAAALEARIPQV